MILQRLHQEEGEIGKLNESTVLATDEDVPGPTGLPADTNCSKATCSYTIGEKVSCVHGQLGGLCPEPLGKRDEEHSRFQFVHIDRARSNVKSEI